MAAAPGKALVTGGAGFIGSHLAGHLLDGGWEVFALDDLSTGSDANVGALTDRPDFHLVVESVLSGGRQRARQQVRRRLPPRRRRRCSADRRAARPHPPHQRAGNGDGPGVRRALRKADPHRLVVGGLRRYHRDEDVLLHEDARRIYGPTTSKRWAYADTKAMDEFLALAHHQERGMDCVIARLFNTVGPRQSGQYGNVIPRFVQAALEGRPLEIHGDGTQTRCFCHVSDVVRALSGLVDARSVSGEVMNVGSTERIRIIDLARRVLEVTGSDSEVVFVPYAEVYGQGIDEMFHRAPAIDRIQAAIGWKPQLGLAEILADVVEGARAARPATVEP